VAFDWRVAGFAAGATLLTGGLFGLLPAWQAARVDLNGVLKDGTPGGGGSRTGRRLGSLLVAGEIAVAVALVVAAGLIGQTLWRLGRVPLGFAPENTGHLVVGLRAKKYATDETVAEFFRAVEQRAAALPGVTHAAVTTRLPLMAYPEETFAIAGQAVPPVAERPRAMTQLVGVDYLATLGVPLLRGRAFTVQDRTGTPRVALVNRLFAEKYFPGADPVGRQLLIDLPASGRAAADKPDPWQIVGVTGNMRMRGLPGEDEPAITLPFAQHPVSEFSVAVRTTGAVEPVLRALRQAINEIDREVLADRMDTFASLVASQRMTQRNQSWLLGGFAAIALVLAALGTYGVITYSVGQRTREIGIRMALGAQPGDVLTLVLRHGLRLAFAGVALGLAASFAVGRTMESLLFGVKAFDVLTWAAAALALVATALVACWLPARRAVRVDPTVALRAE
jgi:putative ABC transport system permease protein